jgi:hypothetical protein
VSPLDVRGADDNKDPWPRWCIRAVINYIRSGPFLTVNVRACVNNYIRSGHSLTVNV